MEKARQFYLGLIAFATVFLLTFAMAIAVNADEKLGVFKNYAGKTTNEPIAKDSEYDTDGYQITRLYDIEVGHQGTTPKVLKLNKGDKVKLTIKTDSMCYFIVEDHDIRVPMYREMDAEFEFTPNMKGTFDYYCGGPYYDRTKMGVIEVI